MHLCVDGTQRTIKQQKLKKELLRKTKTRNFVMARKPLVVNRQLGQVPPYLSLVSCRKNGKIRSKGRTLQNLDFSWVNVEHSLVLMCT